MNARNFFRTEDLPPPFSVKVYLLWMGKNGLHGPFVGVRYRASRSGSEKWATFVDGEIVQLPPHNKYPDNPARSWVGFHNLQGHRPDFWSPLCLSNWSLALPPVAYVWHEPDAVSVRLWSATQSFDAVLAAQEMEADREAARASRENHTEKPAQRLATRWWAHAVGLRYDDPALLPEELGKRMVAWRLHRAIHFAQPFRGYGRLHPQISPALEELAMTQQDIRDRANNAPPDNELAIPIEMLPADDSDFLKALDWFLALRDAGDEFKGPWSLSNQQKVLAHRSLALPRSFREIGDRLTPQVGDERARKIYHDALDHAWLIATGRKKNHIRDQIIALRERNRTFRRSQEGIIL